LITSRSAIDHYAVKRCAPVGICAPSKH